MLAFFISILEWPTSFISSHIFPLLQTWILSLVWEDPLEKGMATHSTILAWRTPWIEEPGHKESDMTEWPFIRYLLFLISAENLGVLAVSDGTVCGMPCSCPSVSMGDWSRTPVDSKIWGCSYLYNGIVQVTIYIHRFWIHGFSQPWIAPQMGNGCLYR